jgi:phenylalanyl-tRNA synthetase beta chain
MWWMESAISETTKNIFIESACFDASSIRLTAQRLWLRSDSSTRYEKSLDPLLTYKALARALDFLEFIWKKWIIEGDFEYLDKTQLKSAILALDPEFVIKKIWVSIPNCEIERILTALWFTYVQNSWIYDVTVPSWRVTKDISIKEDLAEEIGRVFWYEKVPETPVIWGQVVYADNKSVSLRQSTQNYFASKWWLEVYNYSFSNEQLDEKIGLKNHDNSIKILNAYSNEFTIMRRNMVANLLVNVADNKKLWDKFSFFEISKIEWKQWDKFIEVPKIAWISYSKDFSVFQSDLLWFINTSIPNVLFSIDQWTDLEIYPYFHPNKSWRLVLSTWQTIWAFWYINPQVATNFDIDDSKVLYFELDFKSILDLSIDADHIFKELPKYPWIEREINFVMEEKTSAWAIVEKILDTHKFVRSVKILDTYRNEDKLWKDKKSVTFSASLLDYEKTITDEEALNIQNLIITNLSKIWIELRK